MITFINAYRTDFYSFNLSNYNDLTFPEKRGLTEIELVEWVDRVVERFADKNVIIFVASNSIIVFNAFRVAIKKGRLDHEDFIVHFYSDNHVLTEFKLDINAKLAYRPDGFFDMWDKQLDVLL